MEQVEILSTQVNQVEKAVNSSRIHRVETLLYKIVYFTLLVLRLESMHFYCRHLPRGMGKIGAASPVCFYQLQ